MKKELLGGAFALALSAEACSGNPRVLNELLFDHPTVEELRTRDGWRVQTIPSLDTLIRIQGTQDAQSSDVGLRELYIANSEEANLLTIICIWDTDKVNVAALNTFDFQPYQENFAPARYQDQNLNPTMQNMMTYFTSRLNSSLPMDVQNNKPTFTLGIRAKPLEGQESVLVLRVDGKQPSWIKIKLSFEKQSLKLPIIK